MYRDILISMGERANKDRLIKNKRKLKPRISSYPIKQYQS